jgi:hypothetical protein
MHNSEVDYFLRYLDNNSRRTSMHCSVALLFILFPYIRLRFTFCIFDRIPSLGLPDFALHPCVLFTVT